MSEVKDKALAIVAKALCSIQGEYDGADHDTTTVSFMEKYGDNWRAERGRVLGEIDGRRTALIWKLGDVLNTKPDHPMLQAIVEVYGGGHGHG
jgi:hypothetical protein